MQFSCKERKTTIRGFLLELSLSVTRLLSEKAKLRWTSTSSFGHQRHKRAAAHLVLKLQYKFLPFLIMCINDLLYPLATVQMTKGQNINTIQQDE